MEAKDLMIGDWLLFEGEFVQIETIPYDNTITFNGSLEKYISDCKPIPLTLEILEKNGASKLNDIKKFVETEKWFILDNCPFIIACRSDNTFYAGILFSEEIDKGNWFNKHTERLNFLAEVFKIKYVNELQHILKLCKIKKEIIL